MHPDDYRRKAKYFFTLAQQMGPQKDRAAMIEIAAFWMKRAEEVERREQGEVHSIPKTY
jgi:hypothetical protein